QAWNLPAPEIAQDTRRRMSRRCARLRRTSGSTPIPDDREKSADRQIARLRHRSSEWRGYGFHGGLSVGLTTRASTRRPEGGRGPRPRAPVEAGDGLME